LGVLANAEEPAEQVGERLSRLGLAGQSRCVVSSYDLGAAMPDEAAYRAGLAALGLDAHETAFVGHASRRLAGAKRAGLRTIAVNYDPDAVADVFLGRFAELGAMVLGAEGDAACQLCGTGRSAFEGTQPA
jgi:FMN phosphatase YigB (HAD superfamily)